MKGFKKEDFKKELQEGVDRMNEVLGMNEQFEEGELDRLAGFLERLEKSRDPQMMLPSQEKAYLEGAILERLLEKLGLFDLKSRYTLGDALKEFREVSRRERIEEAYARAEAEFERKYPLEWSNEKSCAFRVIDGKRVYSSRCR